MQEEITISYTEKNTIITKGDNKIILDSEEINFVIKSILTNKKIEICIT